MESNVGVEKATSVAREFGLPLAIPQFKDVSSKPTDFNDLHLLEGLAEVRRQVEAAKVPSEGQADAIPDAGSEWPAPVPLDEIAIPSIDVDNLPGLVGGMAKAVSQAVEVPVELPLSLILATISTAIQGKFVVSVRPGYCEGVNIYVDTSLESGNRKSATQEIVTSPLCDWEESKRDEMAEQIKEAASKRANQEARIKSLRAKYGKVKRGDLAEIEAEITEIERGLEEVPTPPQLWCQDVTPERLGSLMATHDERMAILAAEGGIFDILAGRYSNGNPNLDLFLQAHSGDPVRVDRGSRDPVALRKPALTVGVSSQPEVLRKMAATPGFRGRGLLARFLYFFPKSTLGYRSLEPEPVPVEISREYRNTLFSLLSIREVVNDKGRPVSYRLTLTREGYLEWLDFARVVEKDLRDGGRFEAIRDWAGKLPGQAIRLAGILHCSENYIRPWEKQINIGTIQAALELASVFASHAEAVFHFMGTDEAFEGAKRVWHWVKRNQLTKFTKRDCYQSLKGFFHRVAKLEGSLGILEERFYTREKKNTPKVGRPSIQYEVNPALTGRWSNGLA